jgi:hypothetical protein
MAIIYKSGNIEIEDGVINNVKYLRWGDPSWPLLVYLHGIDQVGKKPTDLMTQGPFARGFNSTLKVVEGFKYPEFFNKQIQVIAPILNSGFWEPKYINDFLDSLGITNPMCLMGWSWGGGGAAKYLNQFVRKNNFSCGVMLSMGNYSDPGLNVRCPVKLVHATNDDRTSYKNSDLFYAGVLEPFKAGYSKPSGGGHYAWEPFINPSTGIYEWMKSTIPVVETPPIITYTEGKIELGSDGVVYGNFNGNRIKLIITQ